MNGDTQLLVDEPGAPQRRLVDQYSYEGDERERQRRQPFFFHNALSITILQLMSLYNTVLV